MSMHACLHARVLLGVWVGVGEVQNAQHGERE